MYLREMNKGGHIINLVTRIARTLGLFEVRIIPKKNQSITCLTDKGGML